MSVMSTVPVLRCRRCGATVLVPHLSTTRPDPDGSRLRELMKGLNKIALCEFHRRQRNYYASIGRSAEWELGLP